MHVRFAQYKQAPGLQKSADLPGAMAGLRRGAEREICTASRTKAFISGDGLLRSGGRSKRLVLLGTTRGVVEGQLVEGLALGNHAAAKHEAEGASDDGSAASREAAHSDKLDDIGKNGVDALRRVPRAFLPREDFAGEVERIVQSSPAGEAGVTEAESRSLVLDGKAAATTAASRMRAAMGGGLRR